MTAVAGPVTSPEGAGRTAALVGLLVALTVVASSAVAVALPQLGRDLGLDTLGTAWVLATFSLAFSITTALFGRLADLRGLRAPLRAGVLLLGVGCAVAAFAPSFPVLLAGRVVAGAGAGAVPVLGLGIVTARYTGAARSKALGSLTAVVTVVSGCGPLIGGALAQVAGWRAVLALPAVAVLLVEPIARDAPNRPVHQVPAGGSRSLDLRGAVIVAVVVTGLTLALQAPSTGLGLVPVVVLLATASAAAAGLALHVRARPAGFLPLAVLRDRRIILRGLAGLTVLAAYLGMLTAIPAHLTRTQGWRPLHIGLALLPAALSGAAVSRATGGLAARVGADRLAVGLALGSCAGLLTAAGGAASPVFVVGGMALVVAGFAGGQVALLDGVTAVVDEAVRGAALGVFNLVFFVGGAVGSATIGGLGGVLGLRGALACLAVLPLLGAASAAFAGRPAVPRRIRAERAESLPPVA